MASLRRVINKGQESIHLIANGCYREQHIIVKTETIISCLQQSLNSPMFPVCQVLEGQGKKLSYKTHCWWSPRLSSALVRRYTQPSDFCCWPRLFVASVSERKVPIPARCCSVHRHLSQLVFCCRRVFLHSGTSGLFLRACFAALSLGGYAKSLCLLVLLAPRPPTLLSLVWSSGQSWLWCHLGTLDF